jgi:hypothetical protein
MKGPSNSRNSVTKELQKGMAARPFLLLQTNDVNTAMAIALLLQQNPINLIY